MYLSKLDITRRERLDWVSWAAWPWHVLIFRKMTSQASGHHAENALNNNNNNNKNSFNQYKLLLGIDDQNPAG